MRKVLIINDSGFERMVLRDQVQLLGYDVKTADEFSGLSTIDKYHPDIVIANLTMTDTSGDKLIEQIKNIDPGIRCFLSTCSKNRRHGFDRKVIYGVVETPISLEQLSKLLNDEVDFKATNQENEPALEDKPQRKELKLSSQAFLKTALIAETAPVNPPVNPPLEGNAPETVTDLAFCPYCGKKLEKPETKFVFCPFCGSRL